MKHAMRGLLLSGLILPGLGQYLLGCRLRGAAIMTAIITAVVAVLMKAMREALTMVDELVTQTGAIDVAAISRIAHESVTKSDSLLFTGLLISIIVIWAYSAADAFLIGRRMDRKDGY